MKPPRLYVITDRHATSLPLLDVVRSALAGADGRGDEIAVQLREKDLDARALLDLARALRNVTRAAGAALFINDRVDVALAAGADGVHLGTGALSPASARALSPQLRLALSTHTLDEVDAAAAAQVDFVVFGPVYETPSKHALGFAAQGLASLARACGRGVPVIALGGVDPSRAPVCQEAGAAGVACIRAVMSAADPGAVVRAFLRR